MFDTVKTFIHFCFLLLSEVVGESLVRLFKIILKGHLSHVSTDLPHTVVGQAEFVFALFEKFFLRVEEVCTSKKVFDIALTLDVVNAGGLIISACHHYIPKVEVIAYREKTRGVIEVIVEPLPHRGKIVHLEVIVGYYDTAVVVCKVAC